MTRPALHGCARALLLACTVLTGAVPTTTASAQAAPAPDQAGTAGPAATSAASPQRTTQDTSSNNPTVTERDDQINDVVVTAEKRAEGLQTVPNAITAVTGETLARAGVQQVGDLVQLAPSLQFGTRQTNIFIALRGIGQAGQDIGSQSGVTVSLDGVPLLNHFMMNPTFLDIERVEVLRGPQGTIAGRNATGGAINVYSKGPTDAFDGDVTLTAGNYSRFGVKGFLNAPITDQISARVSFQEERADGYTKNAFLGTRNDDTDLTQIRGQLLYKPSDTVSVRALLDYTRDRGDPSFGLILRRADPARPLVTQVPGYAYPQNNPDDFTFYYNEPNRRDVNDLRATVVAKVDLSPAVSVTSTTGYIQHNIYLTDIDVDATPVATSRFDLIGLYAKQETQEFTLTANLGSRADLVAGLFYMHGDSSEPLYLSLATFKNYLVYLPAETLDSYAGYAQFRYNLTDRLRAMRDVREDAPDRRSQILEGARDAFLRFGFERSSMADIAKGAGVTRTALYHYFPSKDDVFQALTAALHANTHDKAADVLAGGGALAAVLHGLLEAKFGEALAVMNESPHGVELVEATHRKTGQMTLEADSAFQALVVAALEQHGRKGDHLLDAETLIAAAKGLMRSGNVLVTRERFDERLGRLVAWYTG